MQWDKLEIMAWSLGQEGIINQLFDLMQKTILLTWLLLFSVSLFGQSTFHKKIQNSGYIYSTTSLNNGEILGSGTQSLQFGYSQGLLVRFSPDGNILWRRRYPGLTSISNSVETENGFVIIGDTLKPSAPFPIPRNSVVSKLLSNGNVVWSKIFVSPLGQATIGKVMAGDDSYVLSGNYVSNILPAKGKSIFTKLDDDGNTLWSKTYFANVPNHTNSFTAQVIEEDTIYACGQIQGNGCFIRINVNTGEIIGVSSLGGIYLDVFSALKPTNDGNFILAGHTRSTTDSEESRPWIVKVNREGQIIWSKTYNLPGTSLTCHIAEAGNGGFVLSMDGDNANHDYGILAKIDESGNLIWAYNYAGGQQTGLEEIQSTSDGGFVALGNASMLKTDSLGRVSTGCCPAPITFHIENYSPPIQTPVLITEDIVGMTSFAMQAVVDTLFKVQDLCQIAIQPSSVSAICPPGMVLSTAPATPLVVNYPMPTATTDCTCPDLHFSLVQGLPSGSAFPVGITQVCYSASDICGGFTSCCFEVKVEEQLASAVKETSQAIPSPRIRVFPNPSNGDLFIEFSQWESVTAHVRVLNVQGREMMQQLLAIDGEPQAISIPLFVLDGLYFLEIKAENGERQIIKFVLRR